MFQRISELCILILAKMNCLLDSPSLKQALYL